MMLLATGLALETAARLRQRQAREATAAEIASTYAARRLAEERWIAANYPEPPPPCVLEPLDPAEFRALSPEERGRRVDARRELLLEVDAAGNVLTQWGSALGEELAALAGMLVPGSRLDAHLDKAQREDLARAYSDHGAGDFERWYAVDLDVHGPCVFEWRVFPVLHAERPGALILVRNSAWRIMGEAFRPGACVPRFAGYDDLKINAHGFRDEEITVPRPDGLFRIVCIGGSTTVEGRRNDLTYPNFLERRLRSRFPDREVEVINAGVYAMNSKGELAQIDAVMATEPSLVLHYNFINDANVVLDGAYRAANVMRDPLLLLRALARRSVLAREHFGRFLLPAPTALDRALDEWTLAHLQAVADRVVASGAEFAVASFSYPPTEGLSHHEREFVEVQARRSLGEGSMPWSGYTALVDHYNARVRRLCAEKGWHYIAVAEATPTLPRVFTDACHMTAEGLDMRAEAMVPMLTEIISTKRGLRE
jgi:hypothetical protein